MRHWPARIRSRIATRKWRRTQDPRFVDPDYE